MNCNCKKTNKNKIDFTPLDKILKEYGKAEGGLIPILQKTQESYGYLPPEAIERIADTTGIKPAKILGVATFYTQFRLKPAGKYIILLCQGTACHVNGSGAIEAAILDFFAAKYGAPVASGDTTPDGLFTLTNVACIGCCSLAPVMMIDGETYGNLTADKTKEILSKYKI